MNVQNLDTIANLYILPKYTSGATPQGG